MSSDGPRHEVVFRLRTALDAQRMASEARAWVNAYIQTQDKWVQLDLVEPNVSSVDARKSLRMHDVHDCVVFHQSDGKDQYLHEELLDIAQHLYAALRERVGYGFSTKLVTTCDVPTNDDLFVLEVLRFNPGASPRTEQVGYMRKIFLTRKQAVEFYNAHNPHLRRIDAYGQTFDRSDWDPKTRLFYIVRMFTGYEPLRILPFDADADADDERT